MQQLLLVLLCASFTSNNFKFFLYCWTFSSIFLAGHLCSTSLTHVFTFTWNLLHYAQSILKKRESLSARHTLPIPDATWDYHLCCLPIPKTLIQDCNWQYISTLHIKANANNVFMTKINSFSITYSIQFGMLPCAYLNA